MYIVNRLVIQWSASGHSLQTPVSLWSITGKMMVNKWSVTGHPVQLEVPMSSTCSRYLDQLVSGQAVTRFQSR